MHLTINKTAHTNSSEQLVQTQRLYNLLFNGRITLKEYYKALRTLEESTTNN